MSEAAVAELTQETQTGQQPADQGSLAGEQQQVETGASLAGGEQPSDSEANSEESSAGDEFSLDAILKEAGLETQASADDRKLPGKSYEDIQREAEQAAWNEVTSFKTTYLQNAQQVFMDEATNGGMSRDAADKLWQAVASDIKTFDQKHWAAKLRPFSAFAKSDALKEKDSEAYEIFSGNDYAGNPIDMIAGAMAAGRKAELARLQKAGEHISKAQLEKIVTVAKAKGVSEAEAKARAGKSGNNNGVAGATLSRDITMAWIDKATPEQILALSPEAKAQMDRVLNKR